MADRTSWYITYVEAARGNSDAAGVYHGITLLLLGRLTTPQWNKFTCTSESMRNTAVTSPNRQVWLQLKFGLILTDSRLDIKEKGESLDFFTISIYFI
ncbi:hypothetical protein M0802_011168 [Mischocyttarus mexicanus]|nr:hypothetical protein M0802_013666 [Mischocyttarus mexicanus]KAI4489413.1 hypothetical protein M0802_011168 [Mischocyttarus mexicanus]